MGRTAADTVQARDVETVLYMYQMYNVPCFAIWIKDVLFFPYRCESVEDGGPILEQMVERLAESGSGAIYTLKVYEAVPAEGLTNKTGYTAAFNFQLRSIRDENGVYIGAGKQQADPAMMSILQAMQLQMAEMQKRLDEQEPDDEPSLIGQIAGFAETPLGQQLVGKILGAIFSSGNNNQQQITAPVYAPVPKQQATMSGVNSVNQNDEQQQKALQAVEILRTVDPSIGDNLLLLATIAQRDPNQFLGFLNVLKTMA